MTDLSITRGDRSTTQFTILNSAVEPAVAIDLTGAVVRFAVKNFPDQDAAAALVSLRSYYDDEIQLTDAVNGIGFWDLLPWRTRRLCSGLFFWDLEVTRPRESLTSVGTVDVEDGSGVLVGAGLGLSGVREGDLLVASGAAAANQKTVVIEAVGGQGAANDPGAGNILTDYMTWTDEVAVPIEVFRGDVATPDAGRFRIVADVVR